jgi:hypothetical protein
MPGTKANAGGLGDKSTFDQIYFPIRRRLPGRDLLRHVGFVDR